jgi:hypothetical protein
VFGFANLYLSVTPPVRHNPTHPVLLVSGIGGAMLNRSLARRAESMKQPFARGSSAQGESER